MFYGVLIFLGQALCAHCRDTTHRAKMFSSHEVVHMSKCQKEPKRVRLKLIIIQKQFYINNYHVNFNHSSVLNTASTISCTPQSKTPCCA